MSLPYLKSFPFDAPNHLSNRAYKLSISDPETTGQDGTKNSAAGVRRPLNANLFPIKTASRSRSSCIVARVCIAKASHRSNCASRAPGLWTQLRNEAIGPKGSTCSQKISINADRLLYFFFLNDVSSWHKVHRKRLPCGLPTNSGDTCIAHWLARAN